jgi:hypothetical protein
MAGGTLRLSVRANASRHRNLFARNRGQRSAAMEIERPFVGEWLVAGRRSGGSAAESVTLAAMVASSARSRMAFDRTDSV